MADEFNAKSWSENNQQVHNPRQVKNHLTQHFHNAEEAFASFSTIPQTPEAVWEFIVSQTRHSWGKTATDYRSSRRRFQANELPYTYQYVVLEEKASGEIHDFVCDRYPQAQFPVHQYRELYKECVTDLGKMRDFWINGHDEEVAENLRKFVRSGMTL